MSLGVVEQEGSREEFGDSGFRGGASVSGEEDDGLGRAEFLNGLAAGPAGLAGGVVEVGDGDGTDPDLWAEETDRSGDGRLFGADGEPVGGVFDVAAGDDSTVCEQDGGADAEAAVGGVGVMGDGDGSLLEICGLGGVDWSGTVSGIVFRRHDVSEATGCECAMASRVALMVKSMRPI